MKYISNGLCLFGVIFYIDAQKVNERNFYRASLLVTVTLLHRKKHGFVIRLLLRTTRSSGCFWTFLATMHLLRLAWALTGAAICFFVILLIHSHVLKEGQLAAGTCEIVTLDRDSSQPRRTIARQTARCACKKGQIAGTTRARPACVDARIVRSRQWCEMMPCLEDEGCDLLVNQSGWTCTQPGGRVKTTTAL
ncbi:chemokine-like protein TAFA-5a isoform X1 [Hypomesus transpacificus]|uniref:chemokine-like protein TAFA-5a isoform X1 n=1 Tax=Hypomesus transpacificus TaxID=137520 RepID=UPI001F084AC7|nr:chemokine-like protein TAFA-5a isoform X1 [Hypomesus transpacificus]